MPTHLRYRPGATDAAPPDALTTMWSRRDEAAEVPQPIGKRDRATAPPPWAVTQATTPQSTATATATAIPPRTATEQPPTWAPEAIAADLAVTYALRRSPRLPRPRLPRPRPRYRHTATYRDRDTATPPRTATEQPPAWAVTYATAQQSSATARLHHRVPRPRDRVRRRSRPRRNTRLPRDGSDGVGDGRVTADQIQRQSRRPRRIQERQQH